MLRFVESTLDFIEGENYFMQYLFCIMLLCACQGNQTTGFIEHVKEPIKNNKLIDVHGMKVYQRFVLPDSYQFIDTSKIGFGYYLRNLPLKKHGSLVRLYNGSLKVNQSAHIAIIDMEIGNKDLQQCADAVMRLRAEYLFHQARLNEISFTFTNGFIANFSTWAAGNQIQVSGNHVCWSKSTKNNSSYASLRAYCEKVFAFAGSLSLSRQLKPVSNLNDIKSGDVFIRGGSPGHAVIVLDVAMNPVNGKKIFMLAQSYMPAQEIQILKNPLAEIETPWYAVDKISEQLVTPEYIFKRDELMRF